MLRAKRAALCRLGKRKPQSALQTRQPLHEPERPRPERPGGTANISGAGRGRAPPHPQPISPSRETDSEAALGRKCAPRPRRGARTAQKAEPGQAAGTRPRAVTGAPPDGAPDRIAVGPGAPSSGSWSEQHLLKLQNHLHLKLQKNKSRFQDSTQRKESFIPRSVSTGMFCARQATHTRSLIFLPTKASEISNCF